MWIGTERREILHLTHGCYIAFVIAYAVLAILLLLSPLISVKSPLSLFKSPI